MIAFILLLSVSMSLLNVQYVCAENNIVPDDVCTVIVEQLSFIEPFKESFGMSNVDFNNLTISERIPVYESINSDFKEISSVYLIFENQNYVRGTSLTLLDVAQNIYHPSSINWGIEEEVAESLFRSTYNMYYKHEEKIPSVEVILENLVNGYPIYGKFTSSDTNHACAIYGMNATGSTIWLMDPEFGSTTASENEYGFAYISSNSGKLYQLQEAICRYW